MKTFLTKSSTFLNLGYWEILKERSSEIIISAMEIVIWVSLELIYFWEFPSIPKLIEPYETFLELISGFIFDAELRVEISDILFSFDEVIILELRCMVDSMAENDLFCKLEVYALIYSEYSWRTPFWACLKCWISWYLVIQYFSLVT